MRQILVTVLILFSQLAQQALAGFDFSELSQDDVEKVSKDFSALLAHTTVSPAVGLLKEGGWEFGLMLGTVSVPNVNDILTEENPGEEVPYRMYNLGLTGAYAYTRRLTFEFKLLPDLKFGEVRLGSQSLAVKLSLEDKDDVGTNAFRAFITNSYIRTTETVNNASTANQDVDADVKFTAFSYGLTYLYGVRSLIFKSFYVMPYMGAGVIFTHGQLQVKSKIPASIFASQSTEESASPSGSMYLLGLETNYIFTKFGFEYSRVFDSDRVLVKFAFGY